MKCPHCESTDLQKKGRNKQGVQIYRCKNCRKTHTEGVIPPKPRLIRACVNCNKKTKNPKFCSRSCSTTYINKNSPDRYAGRKKKRYCKFCGIETEGRRIKCDDCHIKYPNGGTIEIGSRRWETVKLSDIKAEASYQVHAQVRRRARLRYRRSERPKYCVNCGYDKHYEVCHIKAIADFDTDTVVSEINTLKNLVALCPNCHWELDNGLLEIEEIRSKNDAIV